MDIRSFGLLAAAAFSLAASNAAFANGGAYANGGNASSNGGAYHKGANVNGGAYHKDASVNGGAYHKGDTGNNGGAYDKKGAHGHHGAYANNGIHSNGTYSNGGAHGGGKHSNGGAYGNKGAYVHGGAYGNNGVVASNGDANGKGGAYSNGDDPHAVKTSGASHLALLSGGHEVSPEGKANAGDQDGRGSATVKVDPAAGKLCFAVIVDGIDTPVAAHIHHGGAGQNGPVVVTITAPDSGDPGTASGCVSNLDAWLLKSIKEKPWAYYVNVHTSLYPNGAVRGQLF